MMRARWWLLVFALSCVSIKVAESESEDTVIPPLRWFIATTTFDYLKTNEEGVDEITQHNDHILMVSLDGNIIGPGQVQCRHINPPNEQIVNIASTTEYSPVPSGKKIDYEKKFTYPKQCYQDTYGCITLVHNFCVIPHPDIHTDHFQTHTSTVLKKHSVKPTVGEKLIAVVLKGVDPSTGKITMFALNLEVVNFEECKNLFDPDNVYGVDPEEQLCTERIFIGLDVNDPIALPSGLLFRKDGENYELVGIESKAKEGFSLSTWAPYQCRHENVLCQ